MWLRRGNIKPTKIRPLQGNGMAAISKKFGGKIDFLTNVQNKLLCIKFLEKTAVRWNEYFLRKKAWQKTCECFLGGGGVTNPVTSPLFHRLKKDRPVGA